jgi:hypothetical protein
MELVTVDEVWEAVGEVLAGDRGRSSRAIPHENAYQPGTESV